MVRDFVKRYKFKFSYFLQNWKLGVHVLIGTRYFGVNNEWWSPFPSSCFGEPLWRICWNVITIFPIIRRYRAMKYRSVELGFLRSDTVEKLGWKGSRGEL